MMAKLSVHFAAPRRQSVTLPAVDQVKTPDDGVVSSSKRYSRVKLINIDAAERVKER